MRFRRSTFFAHNRHPLRTRRIFNDFAKNVHVHSEIDTSSRSIETHFARVEFSMVLQKMCFRKSIFSRAIETPFKFSIVFAKNALSDIDSFANNRNAHRARRILKFLARKMRSRNSIPSRAIQPPLNFLIVFGAFAKIALLYIFFITKSRNKRWRTSNFCKKRKYI